MSDDVLQPREPRNRDGLQIWKSDVRRAVKQIGLHKSEVDVCIAMLNHYWAVNKSKNSARGLGHDVLPVHPGLKKIADKAGVSLKSCRRASSVLQKLNIFKVVGFKMGGRFCSQRFVINFNEIFASKGLDEAELQALRPDRKGGHNGGHEEVTVTDSLKINISGDFDFTNVVKFSDHRKHQKERPL